VHRNSNGAGKRAVRAKTTFCILVCSAAGLRVKFNRRGVVTNINVGNNMALLVFANFHSVYDESRYVMLDLIREAGDTQI